VLLTVWIPSKKMKVPLRAAFSTFVPYSISIMYIELRSDTFTKPTPGMLQAMMQASVGDDVFGEDPTVNELEKRMAELFGMEAGIFCPSGTMTNQIGIKVHTRPGDEVICDELSHVYQYEGGGIAFNAGCSVKLLHGNRGRITAAQVEEAINPDDIHKPKSRLVVLENTSNRGGGSCYDIAEIRRIKSLCMAYQLGLHLDGARLWNAMVAKNENPKDYGQLFDSISVCMSKGMGAPVGSVLLGKASFIREARRVRKVFGGGMRQAGYLAAACIYALENHREKLAADHKHAQMAGELLSEMPWVSNLLPPETNILIFELVPELPAAKLVAWLKERGVMAHAISHQSVRLVFHLDVQEEMVSKLLSVIKTF
jgi:threonine aldolase